MIALLLYKCLWSIPTAVFLLTFYFAFFARQNAECSTRTVILYRSILIVYISLLITITLDVEIIWVCIWHNWPIPDVQLFSGNTNFDIFYPDETALMLFENIVLFMPVGVLFPLSYKGKVCSAGWVLKIGMVLSLLIESVQFAIGRTADICDFVMNSCGAILGYVFLNIIRKLYKALVLNRIRR